jgi:KUP system potassium uptake protein
MGKAGREDRAATPRFTGRQGHTPPQEGTRARTAILALGALGVVYGDIGTNPLFALREAFQGYPLEVVEANVIGLLSLVFWSLVMVTTVKYLTFVMRAHNEGEGGILALLALVREDGAKDRRGRRRLLILLGLFGAALLYGDGVITPAISVLAAIEGTRVATPGLSAYVVPTAAFVLLALFLVQRLGTASVGRMFGPVMTLWFVTIAVLGGAQVVRHPEVLRAINPSHAFSFFATNGLTALLVLGAVILVVVGVEALYADMGHFGRRAIAVGWYALVFPSLILVYFGQGALLISDPSAIDNPFYRLAPEWALYPLVVLATVATVIASQALITGAFSLTRQAVQLGYSPRLQIRHTSETQIGQIYVPAVNWLLMLVCLALIIGFRKSSSLAGAYGLAVSGTMVVTTILFYVVVRERFRWPAAAAILLFVVFLSIDLAFFGATLFKIPSGGWLPLVIAVAVVTVLTTWHTGRRLVADRLTSDFPLERFVASLSKDPPVRTPGVGAYLFRLPGATPPSLVVGLRHFDSLHERIWVISVVTERSPRAHPLRRAEITDLGEGFLEVVLHFGFLEDPDVPRALAASAGAELGSDLDTVTYFVGRESLLVTDRPGMARWREHLFALMSRNATSAARYFRLPPEQTIELGAVVEL